MARLDHPARLSGRQMRPGKRGDAQTFGSTQAANAWSNARA
jgi:hypothetical protein